MSSSRKSRANNLRELSYELSLIAAKDHEGEEYQRGYKRDKKAFRVLVMNDARLSKRMRTYFRKLEKQLPDLVDWREYDRRLQKRLLASEIKPVTDYGVCCSEHSDVFLDRMNQPVLKGEEIIRTVEWGDAKVTLTVLLEATLFPTFEVGVRNAVRDTLLPTEVSSRDHIARRAFRKHTLKLAGGLTRTTKNRVKQSLLESLTNNESVLDAARSIVRTGVIDDPFRANMIAHTENIRAFTKGKIEAGSRMKAREKRWDDGQAGACPICRGLDTRVVKFKRTFNSSVSGDSYEGPPAHPWCRCLLKIIL